MKLTRYFFINPRSGLKAHIEAAGMKELSDIAEEVFWTGDYYDRGTLSVDDLSEVIKLIFLNRLRRLRSDDVGFVEVFPKFSVTREYFDNHWSLKCVELETTIEEEMEEAYSINELGPIVSENPRIKEMLKKYQPPTAMKK